MSFFSLSLEVHVGWSMLCSIVFGPWYTLWCIQSSPFYQRLGPDPSACRSEVNAICPAYTVCNSNTPSSELIALIQRTLSTRPLPRQCRTLWMHLKLHLQWVHRQLPSQRMHLHLHLQRMQLAFAMHSMQPPGTCAPLCAVVGKQKH